MGIVPNQRDTRPGWIQDGVPNSNGASSSNNTKKRWSNLMPLFVVLVVIAEINFLGRLDMAKNAALLADSFYQFALSSPTVAADGDGIGLGSWGLDRSSEVDGCEEWLEREDSVEYSRNFKKEPVLVDGGDQKWKSCAVGCKFEFNPNKKADAAFGLPQQSGTASVLRSMESSQYYPENNIAFARRRRGYSIVMTTSLSSDVPVGYFSWAEYDIMAPLQPKTEKALAAAFISNCGARNFRLQALEELERAGIKIDSYGSCHRNHDGGADKMETLKHYTFSLAFENSNEEDYVTEKFFQSLAAGSIPVVVGAPNIHDFGPSPSSLLHLRELKDVESVAKTMKYLAENADAYNQTLRWKFEGPSDSFKALVDMAAVHSSCRLCIYLATTIHEKEEKSPRFLKRPCKCTQGLDTVYHIYVRERGRFEMESIFLRSSNLNMEALEYAVLLKFESLKHVPIWKPERPQSISGGDELKIYRVYPVRKTQREALYTFRFEGDAEFRSHIERNPCARFEVIFV